MSTNSLLPPILSIGDRIAEGVYCLHSSFKRVLNFSRADILVALVDESVGEGPINIVTKKLPLHSQDLRLQITPQIIALENHKYVRTAIPVYHSTPDITNLTTTQLIKSATLLKTILLEEAPSLSLAFLLEGCSHSTRQQNFRGAFAQAFFSRMQNAQQQLFAGKIVEGITQIKGCGFGLTPSGDDFSAGFLLGTNILCKNNLIKKDDKINNLYTAAKGNNIFSNAFLALARDLHPPAPIKDLLNSFVFDDPIKIRQNARKIISLGETSGADFLTGLTTSILHLDKLWSQQVK